MKKHITSRFMLLGFAAVALVAGVCLQGCGHTSEEPDFVLGPSPVSGPEELGSSSALSQPPADPIDIQEAAQPIKPPPRCEINRTADVIFVNYSDNCYVVTVNGRDRGLLLPQENMLVRVPEGDVKWVLVAKGSVKPASSGYLFAKRCGSYTIKVGFDPRRAQKPESVD